LLINHLNTEELNTNYYEACKLSLALTAYRLASDIEKANTFRELLSRLKPLTSYYTKDFKGSGELNAETAHLTAIALYNFKPHELRKPQYKDHTRTSHHSSNHSSHSHCNKDA